MYLQTEHEINLHWAARMDHLEHRMWIEEKDMNALSMGKLSFHRCLIITKNSEENKIFLHVKYVLFL